MGLDMYLSGKRYLSEYSGAGDVDKIQAINELLDIESDDDYGTQEVSVRVAYWRKANAIHNWFVRECQGGVDECQSAYVSREKLLELHGICAKVLLNNNSAIAAELLPTAGGFFFGETSYDEWYFSGIEYTAERLNKILNDPALAMMEFEYHASW